MGTVNSNDAAVLPPTPRQLDVLVYIEQRLTIKEIANRLEMSESAVNKHIRALKRQAGVNSQRDLISYYHQFSSDRRDSPERAESVAGEGYSNSACRKTELPELPWDNHTSVSNDASSIAMVQDSLAFPLNQSWSFEKELHVAPRVLNGSNAAWVRGAAIAMIVFGLFASIIVGLGAAQAISFAVQSAPAGPRTG
jgi:DNA-binding CsgD family transcriptional regulator